MENKRIVIDARESGTSTGRYVDKLVENLQALKPQIDFLILAKPPRIGFFKNIAPNFRIIRCDIKEFTFSEQYGLVWQLYGIKNDMAHFTMTQQPVLYFGRKVTTIHDLTTAYYRNPTKNRLVFWLKQRVYRWVIRRVAHSSTRIIVPSNYVKNQLAAFARVPLAKISVIYEAADKIQDKPEPIKQLVGKDFIMYVGRAQPHKNLNRLIEAFEIARQDHPKLQLVLAGKKDVLYQRLERKTKKQAIKGVVFTDFVSEGQLRWLYENTKAYIFPSLSEGFGLPGLEAMAHGAPLASSKATCLPEVYDQAAHYFDPLDAEDMAAKIEEILSDSKLRTKLIANGQKLIAKYSWRQTAQKTLAIYEQIIESRPKRP